MPKGISKILVTGAAGFIGSEFARQALRKGYEVVVIDKLTYAGDLERLKGTGKEYRFYKADICDKKQIEIILKKERPKVLVNFAAATHVDRSIKNAAPFIRTNILGAQILLDAARKNKIARFIQISSDEAYGEIVSGKFSEQSPLNPNSPYAASKAGADLLIKSYIRTYNFPAIIIRPSNNYGPWQYPEKLIPLTILRVAQGKKTPVYGKGENIREWVYVKDCAEAILLVLRKGKIGEIYNIGSQEGKKNIEVVKQIIKLLNQSENLIEYVKDRPGHDLRYALNSDKLKDELNWQAKTKFEDGLRGTVKWYVENSKWLNKYLSKKLSIKF